MEIILYYLILIIILLVFYNNVSVDFKVDTSYLLLNKISETNLKQIPKKLFQTYHKSYIPNYITDLKNQYAGDYEYYLLNDSDGYNFIKNNFNVVVLKRYSSLSGAHKADLLRYCLLYIYGGVYLDIKTVFTKNLNEIIDHSESEKHKFYSAKSIWESTLYQGFLASTPRNPLFLVLIHKILKTNNIILFFLYHIFTIHIYKAVEHYKKEQNIILYKEKCVKNVDKSLLDRYGRYCYLLDDDNNNIMDVRDPKYPW